MEQLAGWFFLFIVGLTVVALIIDGLALLVWHFWWLVVPAVIVAILVYRRHPGVRAKRQLRAAAKQGNRMRDDIRSATEQAKADMDRIARDWQ